MIAKETIIEYTEMLTAVTMYVWSSDNPEVPSVQIIQINAVQPSCDGTRPVVYWFHKLHLSGPVTRRQTPLIQPVSGPENGPSRALEHTKSPCHSLSVSSTSVRLRGPV